MRKVLKTSNIILLIFLILFSVIFFNACFYINKTFPGMPFEQLLFTLTNAEGTNTAVLADGVKFVLSITSLVIIFIIIFILFNKFVFNKNIYLLIQTKKHNFNIKILPFSLMLYNFVSILIVVSFVYLGLRYIGFDDYIYEQNHLGTLFEDYYVDPRDVDIIFPDEKKNLIFIYVESLESTSASKMNGGENQTSNIPYLEKLALNNLNFSNTDKIGGALSSNGGCWTAGALISYTSGTPLKVPPDAGNLYGLKGESMPGVYSLGEILEDNGYKNYFLMGSESSFGGRNHYFTQHGNYEIYDYYYALDNEWIDKDYREWWGFEDRKLFEFAKKELLRISQDDEPFNFTMLTADTHFYDGYLDKSCPSNSDVQYRDVISCSDKMISDFIHWIKKQDFYKDTVIVVVGDHLSMQPDFFETDTENRTIFNLFINTDKTKNNKNRKFTNLDMFPTTLSALGVEIEGNKLGLGVNLFSGEQTLTEKFGIDEFNLLISYKSDYYNKKIIGNTIYEIEYETEE